MGPSLEEMPWREVYKSTLNIGLQCVFVSNPLPHSKGNTCFFKGSCLASMFKFLGEYMQILLLHNTSILYMIYLHLHCTCFAEYFHNQKKKHRAETTTFRSCGPLRTSWISLFFFCGFLCPPKHCFQVWPSHLSHKKHGGYMQNSQGRAVGLRRVLKTHPSQKAQKGSSNYTQKDHWSFFKRNDSLGYIGGLYYSVMWWL